MTTAEATITYVQAGRRGRAHRRVVVEGVTLTGTERCNLDDLAYPEQPISEAEYEALRTAGLACRHCCA
jgi:hypothetical protein